jgi:2-polyprenyl-3-methyl-5-hydroxy-6-metoxy-1,4-benzoquinol methylase
VQTASPEARISGCDISENAVRYAKRHYPVFNVFVNALPELNTNKSSYDLISALEVINYLDENSRTQAFKEISKKLAPGGYFLFSGTLDGGVRYFDDRKVIAQIGESLEIVATQYLHLSRITQPKSGS